MNLSSSYDTIVVGSGHNGLVTACYLVKAGYKVLAIEKNDNIGGHVALKLYSLDDNRYGFRMDVGSSVHIMIHQTGIIEELELEKYGLEYIDMDPIMSYPGFYI